MAISTTVAVKNARLDAISATWGATPKLRLYSGTPPANAAAALSGNTLLVEITLDPQDAVAGVKNMLGDPVQGVGAAGAGDGTDATFYRVYNSGGTTCFEQGTVSESGADMAVDNANIAQNQVVNFNSWTKTEP
jgi:hypothetical protein